MKSRLNTPLGSMLLEERDGRVAALRFADGGETVSPGGELAEKTEDWLRRYFAGERLPMDLPLSPEGTPFQVRVWLAACAIPYGETLSYGELADRLGCRSARAVGAALAKNPIWILIPCHRVVGKDGALTGYAGGLERKRALLELEKQE